MTADAAFIPVLVADDEEQLLNLCGRVLRREGYSVLPARSGDEALSVFSRHRSDIRVVVIDATIPPDGARPILEAIVRERGDVGVIFTGGDELDHTVRDLLLANEGIFLRKPFPAAALVRAVEDSQLREDS